MTRGAQSFSQRIKDELSRVPCAEPCCSQIELATAFWAAGKFNPLQVDLTTGHAGFAERIVRLAGEQYSIRPVVHSGRELIMIRISQPEAERRICRDIEAIFRGGVSNIESVWPLCCRQALLRALFMACGSVSEPASAYHMELAVRRENAAVEILQDLLGQMGFHSTLALRDRQAVIYLREGQSLADFLLLAGAHQSLLAFESLRVEKEMRSNVNRVVNCDSANLQRVAEAAARQSELLRTLQMRGLDGQLVPELKEAAEIRLDNPDLTLKELGALMRPPLGKSGMNHRLKRFEQRAVELLEPKEC